MQGNVERSGRRMVVQTLNGSALWAYKEGEVGREDVHREVRKASGNSYPLLALKNGALNVSMDRSY